MTMDSGSGRPRSAALRTLPSINVLLEDPTIVSLIDDHGREVVTHATRRVVDQIRDSINEHSRDEHSRDEHFRDEHSRDESPRPVRLESIVAGIADLVGCITRPSLKPVINATGVILHTNLGRAPLGRVITDELISATQRYSNLEYDLKRSHRGDRNDHLRLLLSYLTTAEDALVVNNNAAGIMLVLNTLAAGREVVISRGELIEIGGSFRIPEIMKASGGRLVEVGTTNRTRVSDYERAIGPETGLIFKAHHSNFAMIGFTEEVPATDLACLAHVHELPLVFDIGSGLLRKASEQGLGSNCDNEPDVQGALAAGADLVLFSCDKLLGGPQAGIVAGRKSLVMQLARSPLMRVLRVGKLTVAVLAAVLRQQLDKRRPSSCPIHTFFNRSDSDLNAIAARIVKGLERHGIPARAIESVGQSGGGSLPGCNLKSVAVEVLPPSPEHPARQTFAEQLFTALQRAEPAVLGVLREGHIVFDVLAVFEEEVQSMVDAIAAATGSLKSGEGPP